MNSIETTNNEILAQSDPFGLEAVSFKTRIPERAEMFTDEEAQIYIDGCDFPESADDLLLAWETDQRVASLSSLSILDAMSGPGRLGRELLNLGAAHVTFHDGHSLMMSHAVSKASELFQPERISQIVSPVNEIAAPDNTFDLVICHNSTHQLESEDKLQEAISEFVRVTRPGGFVIIADFQRRQSPEFIAALTQRLKETKPEIIPLLIPTFQAAFSKEEFDRVVAGVRGVAQWIVIDAALPMLTDDMNARVQKDPVKGHVLDFSPISCRVIIQKEEI